MNDGRELLNENYPDCSFYLHSTCVSITKNIFEDAESSCLPGCTEYSIHQESIHVSFSFITPIHAIFANSNQTGKTVLIPLFDSVYQVG